MAHLAYEMLTMDRLVSGCAAHLCCVHMADQSKTEAGVSDAEPDKSQLANGLRGDLHEGDTSS